MYKRNSDTRSSDTSISHARPRFHIRCNISFPRIVTGVARPSGSKTLDIVERIERLVINSGIDSRFVLRVSTSRVGVQVIPNNDNASSPPMFRVNFVSVNDGSTVQSILIGIYEE